ncbi:unnamed protein product [Cylicocyclus nassatus]|uniref:Uncharacterized protein n=1 Tax=Cylicocyclus nassatus TaxID=53992 RepID=A0AA36DLE4_CYLNA|nr:unnamed protein product [Cylicocyclus nassatus]
MSSVISSSWSMWSPWSFCSNNVMVRVRACSTVRGYKCAGHNKEFQSCDSSLLRTPQKPAGSDVDVVDPYSEDRRIAMKQLYQDYEVEVPDSEKGEKAPPRVRPASPAEPREPTVIAQYARRFPQPPSSEGLQVVPPGGGKSVELSHDTNEQVPAGEFAINMSEPTFLSTTYPTTTSTSVTQTTTATTTERSTTTEPLKPLTEPVLYYASTDEPPSSDEAAVPERVEPQLPNTRGSEVSVSFGREQLPPETSISFGKEQLPIGGMDEQFQEDEEAETDMSEDEFLGPFTATAPSTFSPFSTTEPQTTTTTTVTATVAPPVPLQHVLGVSRQKPQMAANIKPTSFVVSAVQVPVKNVVAAPEPINAPLRAQSSEYEKENLRGKQSRRQRLKKLNRRAKLRSLVVSHPGSHLKMKSDRRKIHDVENEIEELRKRIRKTKRKLAAAQTTTTPAAEEPADIGVDGDTARALEWMIANAAKMVNERSNGPLVDNLPVERVDADSDTEITHLPSGVQVISEQNQFVLKEDASNDPVVKVDRRVNSGERRVVDSGERDTGAEWSEWSKCNCGTQTRKSTCPATQSQVLGADYRHRRRQRRSVACIPEFETRPCRSTICQQ